MNNWNKKEEVILKKLWESERDMDVIFRKLPGRTRQALRLRASKLGIKRLCKPDRVNVKKLNLKKDDAIYLAAFMDADGTIGLHKGKRDNRIVPRIGYINTYKPILDWVLDTLNCGGIRSTLPKKRLEGGMMCKAAHQWQLNGRYECSAVLKAIHPYLKIKQRQAEIVIEWIDLSFKRNPAIITSDKEEKLYNEIKRLNRKGHHEN